MFEKLQRKKFSVLKKTNLLQCLRFGYCLLQFISNSILIQFICNEGNLETKFFNVIHWRIKEWSFYFIFKFRGCAVRLILKSHLDFSASNHGGN